MKLRIEAKEPKGWEPYACEKCPFSYLGDYGYDGLKNVCPFDNSHICPAKEVDDDD